MREDLVEQVLAEVQRRQREQLPAALLIGEEPPQPLGWCYVNQPPYAAVVIGSMDAGALLRFPDDACLDALLKGLPVYVWEEGLTYRSCARTANRALWARLVGAERQMKQLGVRPLGRQEKKLITAQEARRLLEAGLPVQGRLTPLARDILEGKG